MRGQRRTQLSEVVELQVSVEAAHHDYVLVKRMRTDVSHFSAQGIAGDRPLLSEFGYWLHRCEVMHCEVAVVGTSKQQVSPLVDEGTPRCGLVVV